MPSRVQAVPSTEKADINALLYKEISTTDWKEQGLCWQSNNPIFFDPEQSQIDKAIQVCRGCPVRLSCLKVALGSNGKTSMLYDGVWGGYSPPQRRTLRRKLLEAKRKS